MMVVASLIMPCAIMAKDDQGRADSPGLCCVGLCMGVVVRLLMDYDFR